MENEPTVPVTLPIYAITMYQSEEGVWCIQDKNSGVSTFGDTKYEALLMLADALAGHDDADIDLVEASEQIFTLSDEQKEWIEDDFDEVNTD